MTVVGEPGVGKSRLAAEFVARVGTRARVVRGTLSLLRGGHHLLGGRPDRARAGRDQGRALARRGAGAASRRTSTASPNGQRRRDEDRAAARARRRLGDRRRRRRRRSATSSPPAPATQPLVVLVDDIQWAEPALLDLLAGLPAAIGDAPILLLCLARPELLENRPDWQVTVRLEPFGERDVDALLEGLLGTRAGRRARTARERVGRQPALRRGARRDARRRGRAAAARTASARSRAISTRSPCRRACTRSSERASTGSSPTPAPRSSAARSRARSSTAAPSWSSRRPRSRPSVPAELEALVGKDLIRPAEASFAGEAAFRFKHILVRDAAYQATAKKLRGDLHEQFAGWLERLLGSAGDRVRGDPRVPPRAELPLPHRARPRRRRGAGARRPRCRASRERPAAGPRAAATSTRRPGCSDGRRRCCRPGTRRGPGSSSTSAGR